MSAAGRPLYFRILRLNHIRPRPALTFVLFEGSIVAAALLSLAEIVSWWGVLAIPLTVAFMVKLHDIVAGAVTAPLTLAAAGSPLAAGVPARAVVGRSPVPRPGYLAATRVPVEPSSATRTAEPPGVAAPPVASRTARGVAVVRPSAPTYRPRPNTRTPQPPSAFDAQPPRDRHLPASRAGQPPTPPTSHDGHALASRDSQPPASHDLLASRDGRVPESRDMPGAGTKDAQASWDGHLIGSREGRPSASRDGRPPASRDAPGSGQRDARASWDGRLIGSHEGHAPSRDGHGSASSDGHVPSSRDESPRDRNNQGRFPA